jgi:hypothetical protein
LKWTRRQAAPDKHRLAQGRAAGFGEARNLPASLAMPGVVEPYWQTSKGFGASFSEPMELQGFDEGGHVKLQAAHRLF